MGHVSPCYEFPSVTNAAACAETPSGPSVPRAQAPPAEAEGRARPGLSCQSPSHGDGPTRGEASP